MSAKKKTNPRSYGSFEEYLSKHPNPMRTVAEEPHERDELFGNQLAQKFLRELSAHFKKQPADGA